MKSGALKRWRNRKGEELEESCGNVFADLGLPNPEELLAKAELAHRIHVLIKQRKLTQRKAAELLGIDPALFTGIHAADGRDQMRARAMQRALWPATIGYWMDKLLAPVFSDDAITSTRWFFTRFVSGRGLER